MISGADQSSGQLVRKTAAVMQLVKLTVCFDRHQVSWHASTTWLITSVKWVQQMQSCPAVQVHAVEGIMLGKDVGERDSQLQSNHSLQQTVLQQQADISRLESELAAMQHRFQNMGRSVTLCPLPAPSPRIDNPERHGG